MRSRKTLCMHVELPSSYLAVLESLVATILGEREGERHRCSFAVARIRRSRKYVGSLARFGEFDRRNYGNPVREARNTDGGEAAKKRWQKAFRFITNGQSIKRQPPREFNEWKQLSRWH